MNTTAKVVKAYIESKGFNCQAMEGRENVLWSSGSGDNIQNVRVIMNFTDEGGYVSLRSYNLCKFDDSKKADMYKVCSELNARFKWVKFYVDESDNTITCQDDAIIQLDSAGPECFELLLRMYSIMDDSYPVIMKTVWK